MNLYAPNLGGRATLEGAGAGFSSPPTVGNRLERLLLKILAIEFGIISATCFLTSAVYFKAVLTQWPSTGEYTTAAFLIAFVVILTAIASKQYVAIQAQPRDRFMWSGLGAVTLGFSLFLSFLFLFKIGDWYSRGTFFFQFLGVSVAMLIARGSMHGVIRRAINSGSVEARKVIIVGDAKSNADVIKRLRLDGIRSAGVFQLPNVHGKPIPGAEICSPLLRNFVERCRGLKPDDIIFLAAPTDLPRIALLVNPLSELPASVHIIPTGESALWESARVANLGGTATIQIIQPPLSAFDLAVKRAFDVCTAAFGLIILSPLLLTVALAIKLDSRGSVLFRQNRHGYNNELIPVIKFRTMNVVEDGETAKTFKQAKANDSRLTRFGRILRRTNIDELPQLLNVLRGDMSIVGPRPHPLALNITFRERIVPFSRRHNVKPGLTGWAQIHGLRGETDTMEKMERRVQYDLFYIDNWSFLLDMKIILLTLFSRGAYQNAV